MSIYGNTTFTMANISEEAKPVVNHGNVLPQIICFCAQTGRVVHGTTGTYHHLLLLTKGS